MWVEGEILWSTVSTDIVSAGGAVCHGICRFLCQAQCGTVISRLSKNADTADASANPGKIVCSDGHCPTVIQVQYCNKYPVSVGIQ